NYAARNNMKAMAIGDLGFFYHSNEGLDIVGIAEVCKLAHPDTTTDDPRWECVDIRAVKDVPNPPTLEQVKANPKRSEMALVRPALGVRGPACAEGRSEPADARTGLGPPHALRNGSRATRTALGAAGDAGRVEGSLPHGRTEASTLKERLSPEDAGRFIHAN